MSISRNHVSKVETEEGEETEEEDLPPRRPPCFDHDPLLHYPGYLESIEIGWSLLRGLGAPADITLAGPNPTPTDFDLEDFLTKTLDTLGTLNKWCEKCGGRFTAICPECTAGPC